MMAQENTRQRNSLDALCKRYYGRQFPRESARRLLDAEILC